MLAGLLLSGITASVLATIALFIPLPARLGDSALLWTKRLIFAVVGTVVLALAGALSVAYVGQERRIAFVCFIALCAASLIWVPLTRKWSGRAHLCWSMNMFLFAAYLAFMLDWTFRTPLGIAGQVGR